jgi:hypothetical protein
VYPIAVHHAIRIQSSDVDVLHKMIRLLYSSASGAIVTAEAADRCPVPSGELNV